MGPVRALALLLLGAFAISGTDLAPAPSLCGAINIETYKIEGRTGRELRASLKELGPKDIYGSSRYAVTEWDVAWKWPFAADGSPRFSETRATCDVKIKLPEWSPPPDVEAGLTERWRTLSAALLKHEMNHANHALQNGELVAQAVRDAYQNNPVITWYDANKAAFKVLRKLREFDSEYDEKTNNGKEEGISGDLLYAANSERISG